MNKITNAILTIEGERQKKQELMKGKDSAAKKRVITGYKVDEELGEIFLTYREQVDGTRWFQVSLFLFLALWALVSVYLIINFYIFSIQEDENGAKYIGPIVRKSQFESFLE